MDVQSYLNMEMQEALEAKKRLVEDQNLMKSLVEITRVCIEAFEKGAKTLFAGNGGSAADAQHLACEFVTRLNYERPGLPSISLAADSSILTGGGNDYGYELVFARQIEALGNKDDVFFAISTSGQSKNVLKAIEVAKAKGLITVALTSSKGAKMAEMCDYALQVPSKNTQRIQEGHITLGHMVCAGVEQAMFPASLG